MSRVGTRLPVTLRQGLGPRPLAFVIICIPPSPGWGSAAGRRRPLPSMGLPGLDFHEWAALPRPHTTAQKTPHIHGIRSHPLETPPLGLRTPQWLPPPRGSALGGVLGSGV